jgi:hypothetical protein
VSGSRRPSRATKPTPDRTPDAGPSLSWPASSAGTAPMGGPARRRCARQLHVRQRGAGHLSFSPTRGPSGTARNRWTIRVRGPPTDATCWSRPRRIAAGGTRLDWVRHVQRTPPFAILTGTTAGGRPAGRAAHRLLRPRVTRRIGCSLDRRDRGASSMDAAREPTARLPVKWPAARATNFLVGARRSRNRRGERHDAARRSRAPPRIRVTLA